MEKLAKLKPVFDRTSGRGTLTAGNSSPLTDGAAAIWVGTEEGINRLPAALPRARLLDFELAAVDIFHEGLLMAPVSAIPRLLARHGLNYDDIALWEIHEAFSAQVLCHIKGLEDEDFVRAKAGVEHNFGSFPRQRMNPNGGSVALGHPFAATGAQRARSGGQGAFGVAAGQPRRRQHLFRRRSRHRGAARTLSRIPLIGFLVTAFLAAAATGWFAPSSSCPGRQTA